MYKLKKNMIKLCALYIIKSSMLYFCPLFIVYEEHYSSAFPLLSLLSVGRISYLPGFRYSSSAHLYFNVVHPVPVLTQVEAVHAHEPVRRRDDLGHERHLRKERESEPTGAGDVTARGDLRNLSGSQKIASRLTSGSKTKRTKSNNTILEGYIRNESTQRYDIQFS